MLVLSRREGEKIVFLLPEGGEIVVSVVESVDGRARLGIIAPQKITVLREELLKRGKKDGREPDKVS